MGRSGVTLVEILVVIAILVVVMAVSIPAVSTVLEVQKTGAAKDITRSYRYLRDEATLRNVTFRMAYDLDNRQWWIEAGDPDTLIFMNPEELQEYEERRADELSSLTESEREQAMAEEQSGGFRLFDIFNSDATGNEGDVGGLAALFGGGGDNAELEDDDPYSDDFREGATDQMDVDGRASRMGGMDDGALNEKHTLPEGMYFVWIWSQQYGGKIEPRVDFSSGEVEQIEEPTMVYSYIFPDGRMEYVVIRMADIDDPEEGYTIVVEPLSGQVHYETEEMEPEDLLSWLPTQGPEAQVNTQ